MTQKISESDLNRLCDFLADKLELDSQIIGISIHLEDDDPILIMCSELEIPEQLDLFYVH